MGTFPLSSPGRLDGDVVVVTGASRGIGRAIAERCAAEGAKLVVCARTKGPLDESVRALSASTEVWGVLADVSREDEVNRLQEEALSRFGRVDAVVNNAGGAESMPFLKTTRELWDRMFRENATSAFLVSRAFLPGMTERGSGCIVMIASLAAKRGAVYVAAYTAAKHAMLGLARCLAAEFGSKGIRVNSICPGYVDTPMTERSIANITHRTGRNAAEARRTLEAMNPQKRFIRPDEVADLCVTLLARDCPHQGEAFDL
ncbi:MAG: SDR family oxidoreductase [Planctomycetes bacterium]|nr:SDR family oxidoreductase [Planctomycetota bacterium]